LLIAADSPDTSALQEALNQLLTAVVAVVVAAVGTFGSFYIRKWLTLLEVKAGKEQFDWLEALALSTVTALAQNPAFKEWTGESLKQYAVDTVKNYAETHKLPFTEEAIDNAIEAAYYWFKKSTQP
jgi:hypothetical protein